MNVAILVIGKKITFKLKENSKEYETICMKRSNNKTKMNRDHQSMLMVYAPTVCIFGLKFEDEKIKIKSQKAKDK